MPVMIDRVPTKGTDRASGFVNLADGEVVVRPVPEPASERSFSHD